MVFEAEETFGHFTGLSASGGVAFSWGIQGGWGYGVVGDRTGSTYAV